MKTIKLDFQVVVNKPAALDGDKLIDLLTDHIYKFYKESADVQTVQVIKINDASCGN